jgi:hypothetical protein
MRNQLTHVGSLNFSSPFAMGSNESQKVPAGRCSVMPTFMAQNAGSTCENASATRATQVRSDASCIDESRVPRGARALHRGLNPEAIGHLPRLNRGYLLDGTLPLREAENRFSYKKPSAGLSNRATIGFPCGHDEEDM